MKINFYSNFDKQKYSGGRIHTWMFIKALLEENHHINLITNNKPFFLKENHNENLNLIDINNKLSKINKECDLSIISPNIDSDIRVMEKAIKQLNSTYSKSAIIDFETLAWYNSSSNTSRHSWRYILTNFLSKNSDLIISSTHYGSSKAKKSYLNKKIPDQIFTSIYPPVLSNLNSFDKKEYDIMFLFKNDRISNHKNFYRYFKAIRKLKGTYKILAVGNLSENDKIAIKSLDKNLIIDNKSNITDIEKFYYMKKSRLFLFLSNFEGFGLPPVEAALNGQAIISSDLPTLNEIFKNKITIIKEDNECIDLIENESIKPFEIEFLKDLQKRVSFTNFKNKLSINLKKLLNKNKITKSFGIFDLIRIKVYIFIIKIYWFTKR